MKKIFPLALLLICTSFTFSQVKTDASKKVPVTNRNVAAQTKIIPAVKAASIRKNVVDLKVQLAKMSDSIAVTKREIDNVVDKMKTDLDSMSEMGETESLRLQMAMDRLSKMMSTLSNIMKKISDTDQQITQNLK